ncbi:hypothetical protein ACRALDRAFT_1077475 [Sodiomyces alcalophilus JCM 7366]|uniref:uncharacterized protein n=1 Tax=Sodiomyces alcalophilus JCM 7366 TaxID=591952 RepID=UPI0039B3DD67
MKLSIVAAIATFSAAVLAKGTACGCRLRPCPPDEFCVPLDPKCVRTDICPGVCQPLRAEEPYTPIYDRYERCHLYEGEAARQCPQGSKCMLDPRRPDCERTGICVPDRTPKCNERRGIRCPDGMKCYDLPGVPCDSREGCDGICLWPLLTEG